MSRTFPICLLLFLWYPRIAIADEDYDFHRLTCDSGIPGVELRKVVYYNVGHIVWPERGATAPVKSLRQLESINGLYSLDPSWNHRDLSPIKRNCGPYQITFHYEKVEWAKEQWRWESRVNVSTESRKLFSNIDTHSFISLRAYKDQDGEDNLGLLRNILR